MEPALAVGAEDGREKCKAHRTLWRSPGGGTPREAERCERAGKLEWGRGKQTVRRNQALE